MAVFPEGIEVLPCSVSFVAGKIVTGVVLVVSIHDSIAGYFGDHRGGCNGKAAAVSPLEGQLGSCRGDGVYTINQDEVNRAGQLCNRLCHCFQACFENIGQVNLVMVDYSDANGECSAYNICICHLALGGGQLLGIINTGEIVVGWQDNSCGDHRAGQGTTANFIDAGNMRIPPPVEKLFRLVNSVKHRRMMNARKGLSCGLISAPRFFQPSFP